jgi:hypothetical protein
VKIREGSHLQPFLNLDAIESSSFHPTGESFDFVASHHRRGNFDESLALRIAGTSSHFAIEALGKTYPGTLISLARASLQSCDIHEFEAELPAQNRKESCYGIVVHRPTGCELLMISERESFDVWVEGSIDLLSRSSQGPRVLGQKGAIQ